MYLEELIEERNRYLYRHVRHREHSDRDNSINDISRGIISALRRERGACYLANFYFPKDVLVQFEYTVYTGQKICDADFHIATPIPDEALKRMIIAYNTPPTRGSETLLNHIYDRLKEIGGFALLWT